jgi:hypothetical protein
MVTTDGAKFSTIWVIDKAVPGSAGAGAAPVVAAEPGDVLPVVTGEGPGVGEFVQAESARTAASTAARNAA